MKKICQFWQEFLVLPIKSKLGVVALLFFTFLFGFSLSVVYWRIKLPLPVEKVLQQIPFIPKEEKKPVLANLILTPEKQGLKSGQRFSVTINLKTGDFKADVVDAILTFDPKVLAVEKISPGMFFAEYPIQKWEKDKIFLTGTIGFDKKQVGGAKGEGALGSVAFKAVASGVTKVDFDKSSLVATKGENVLGETKGGSFEIY